MAKKSGGCGCGGCLLKIVIAIAVIIILLVIAAVIIVNLTPEQIGIADLDIGGMTLRELGLADVKFKEMFQLINGVMNPDVDNIVTNRYDPDVAKPEADGNLAAATNTGDGEFKYSEVLEQTVIYDKEYLYTYSDTTLAYLFQQMLNEAETEGAEVNNDAIAFLRDLNAEIDEVTINDLGGGKYELRVVASIDITDFKNEIMKNIPAAVARFVTLPDRVYIVSYSDITADSEGQLVTTGKSIRINDMQSVVADAIFKVVAGSASDKIEGENGSVDQNAINDMVGEGFAEVIANLGRIGSADINAETKEVVGNVNFGVSGIKANALTVITYTAQTAPGGAPVNPAALTPVSLTIFPTKITLDKKYLITGPLMFYRESARFERIQTIFD